MKDRERYRDVDKIVTGLQTSTEDMIGEANNLECEGYDTLAAQAREIAGLIENLAHDLFQANLKDNA